jgi:hypothetical protein
VFPGIQPSLAVLLMISLRLDGPDTLGASDVVDFFFDCHFVQACERERKK